MFRNDKCNEELKNCHYGINVIDNFNIETSIVFLV